MITMQSEAAEVSNGTQRMRRYRERRRQGVVCIARIPIYALDVETLMARNRLKPGDESNRAKVAEAVEALVDDFTEGKLTATAGPLIGDGKSE